MYANKSELKLTYLFLKKVGAIVVNDDDPKGCSFTMQVLGRPYYLRAESRAVCKDWVITLNRIKEARLQQGNVKLVNHHKHLLFRSPPDLLDRNVSTYTQGVVAVANRQRTRAVDESVMDNIEEMMLKGQAEPGDAEVDSAGYYEAPDSESLSQVVLARWQKRKSSMSKVASKVSRWARSLKKYNCADEDTGVRLDRHVHPPGHDNPKVSSSSSAMCAIRTRLLCDVYTSWRSFSNFSSRVYSLEQQRSVQKSAERQNRAPMPQTDPGLSGWIGKETSLAVKGGPVVIDPDDSVQMIDQTPSDPISLPPPPVSSVAGATADDGETRELS